MLIASTNPVIAYYHNGFLRVSLHKYDVNSNEKSVLLTNTHLSKKFFNIAATEGSYNGLNEQQLKDFQMWTLEDLQGYLLEQGLVTDNNWLENHFRPEFKRAMIHLIRMSQEPFLKRSQIFELYGVDFMLDDNLDLWYIETNSGPSLLASSDYKEKFITNMLIDKFEVVIGLLRSRMKRVIDYLNTIEASETLELPSGYFSIRNLEEKRREFKKLTKNYFEPEFMPKSGNGFEMIINENLSGTERYFDLISEECL